MDSLSTFTGLCLIVICFASTKSLNIKRSFYTTLSVTNGGPWGAWFYPAYCQPHKFAVGFSLKIERYQGSDDDTALNGVKLHCEGGYNISSADEQWGEWTDMANCAYGTYIVGFRLQVEKYQLSGDDTAANFMRVRCRASSAKSKVTELNIGNGSGLWGTYGPWSDSCPDGEVVCGIQSRVELWREWNDDTALNDIRLLCCKT